jgi:hypothetical protein
MTEIQRADAAHVFDGVEQGYYRATKKIEAGHYGYDSSNKVIVSPGDVVYVPYDYDIKDRAYFIFGPSLGRGRDDYEAPCIPAKDFKNCFEPAEESDLDRRLEELSGKLAELQEEGFQATQALEAYKPHILPGGEVATGTEIVRSDAVDVKGAKKGLKLRANEVEKFTHKIEGGAKMVCNVIETKQAILAHHIKQRMDMQKKELDAQLAIFKTQVAGMTRALDNAKEALWTINLYLGSSEHIYLWREGRPAPADEPIRIQQRVLFMDEECMVSAHDGGIDVKNLDAFKDWVLSDERNLQQLIPWERGMVALTVRRREKEYEIDTSSIAAAFVSVNRAQELNEANLDWTYFLCKNGENIYWVTTDFTARSVLVPKRDEFLGYFTDEKGDLLEAGDERYMLAMEKAGRMKKHYLRVALIFQGLIDRTTIFAPMAQRPNFMQEGTYGTSVILVNDAESMLEDGTPPFKEWLREANRRMDLGCRIVGAFNAEKGLRQFSQESKRSRWEHINDRLTPGGAEYPKEGTVYTLDKRSRTGMLAFGYSYPVDRYVKGHYSNGRWVSGEYVKKPLKCTCRIDPGQDSFVINIDGVTAEEIRRHLNNRTNRMEYIDMVPLLKSALKAKEAEEEEEKPFVYLINSKVAAVTGLHPDDAMRYTTELVKWYKTKNKFARALVGDDEAKAIKQILAELPNVLDRERREAEIREHGKAFADWVRREVPNVLMVAHDKGPEFRVIEKAGGIWVHEHTWKVNKDTYGHVDTKHWTVIDNRHLRWGVVFQDVEAWDAMEINPNRNAYLTPDETKYLVDHAWEAVQKRHRESDSTLHLMGIRKVRKRDKIEVLTYVEPTQPLVPDRLLTGDFHEPSHRVFAIEWKKEGNKLVKVNSDYGHQYGNEIMDVWFDTSEPTGEEVFYVRDSRADTIFFRDDAVAKRLKKAQGQYKKGKEESHRLQQIVDRAMTGLEETRVKELEQALYSHFMEEHGDIELWEGHKKQHAEKLTYTIYNRHDVWNRRNVDLIVALKELVEQGVNIEGMTVRAVLAGFKGHEEDEVDWTENPGGSKTGIRTGQKVLTKKNDVDEFLLDYVITVG